MSKFGRKLKAPPEGFEYLEPTLTALDTELREKVNEPHEGMRKTESQWPVHQINWQRSRYVYDMYYTYNRISREVYDYCINNKLVDAGLIAKWKKPGYERLCSTFVINPRNYKFGSVSICRVPRSSLPPGTEVRAVTCCPRPRGRFSSVSSPPFPPIPSPRALAFAAAAAVQIEDPTTGCRGCASGSGGNIFGNKYGQYLAAIQIAREERQGRLAPTSGTPHCPLAAEAAYHFITTRTKTLRARAVVAASCQLRTTMRTRRTRRTGPVRRWRRWAASAPGAR